MERVSPDSPIVPEEHVENNETEKNIEQALDRATKLALETVDEMFHQSKQE